MLFSIFGVLELDFWGFSGISEWSEKRPEVTEERCSAMAANGGGEAVTLLLDVEGAQRSYLPG